MWWYFTYFLLLFVCLTILIIRKQNLKGNFIYLFCLLTSAIIVEGINYLWDLANNKQFLVFHLYQPIEYIILGLLYYRLIINKKIKRILLFSIPIYVLFCIVISLTKQPITELDTYAFNTEAILLIIVTSIYLLQIANKEIETSMYMNPLFWVSLGLLVFYAGTFFQMGLHNLIKSGNPDLAKKLYIINYFLNYLMYLLFCVGFYVKY